MVGQDPSKTLTNPTTNIAAPVIPVIVTFADNTVFDPTAPDAVCSTQGTPLSLMLASPLFNDYNYTVGGTNVGNTLHTDFFQRANFWNYTNPSGINPNYHILLNGSSGTPLKVTVPSGSGKTTAAHCGRIGEMDINWFDNYLLNTGFTQLAANGVTLASMPVFMLYNVVMYDTTASSCCILGYHSALNNPNYSNGFQTYVVADFDTSGSFDSQHTNIDVSSFSHEIAELIDDPTGSNPTPPWGNVGQVSGCQSNLEVGDPLSGTDVPLTMPNAYTYHVQELAFVSWFYRLSPSNGVNGWYSSNGTFKTPAAACYTSTTTLSISPTTIVAGGSATVKITVAASGRSTTSAGTPTGTVTLVSGATGNTLETWTLSGGAVNATVSNLPSGTYSVTAQYAGDATFSPSTSRPVTISVGTGTVSFSPTSLSFGSQALQTSSASQTVTLTNNGTAALANIAISLAGASPGDFSQTNNCPASLAMNLSCAIAVVFKPTAVGLRTASISVGDNAASSPQTVPLSGTGTTTGTGSLSLNPTSLSFGNENLGTTSAGQTINVSNTGTAALTLAINVTGADPGDFPGTTNCPRSLAAKASCTVTISFKPSAVGARTASVTFGGGTTVSATQSVALSGTGVSTGAPAVTLSASSLTFANQGVGSQSASQSVTITNSGTGALSLTSLTLTGADPRDFPGTTNCPSLLAASASCNVTLRFRPTATGARTASLSIADNAAGSPQSVALSGTGVAATTHSH
jgi:hypothetical protein